MLRRQNSTVRSSAFVDGDTLVVLEEKSRGKSACKGLMLPRRTKPLTLWRRKRSQISPLESRCALLGSRGTNTIVCPGNVYVDSVWVNRTLVEKGMAWAYKPSTTKEFKEAETSARTAKHGIWTDKNPIPPWEFRSRKYQPK